MSIRICLAAAFLLSVTYGVSSASVAVDLIDTSVKVDNATVVDNSTKSLNMSDSSFIKIRDVIEVAKLGPMCQCLCTNVTDVDVQIKSVPRLDSSTDSASKEGSHFFEVRAVRQVNGSDANVKLVISGNDKLVGNSTDKALNGSESNVTDSATLPPSIVVRDVDVQLVKLDANVSDASAAKSTLNSTDDLAFLRSLEERAVDGSELDEGFLGDTANVSNITSVILELAFDVAPNASQSNVSSLIIERETDEDGQEFDNTGFDESDMDLEGLVLLKDENNSTANANSTFDLEGSEKASDE